MGRRALGAIRDNERTNYFFDSNHDAEKTTRPRLFYVATSAFANAEIFSDSRPLIDNFLTCRHVPT